MLLKFNRGAQEKLDVDLAYRKKLIPLKRTFSLPFVPLLWVISGSRRAKLLQLFFCFCFASLFFSSLLHSFHFA
jgi:hypothetical protein